MFQLSSCDVVLIFQNFWLVSLQQAQHWFKHHQGCLNLFSSQSSLFDRQWHIQQGRQVWLWWSKHSSTDCTNRHIDKTALVQCQEEFKCFGKIADSSQFCCERRILQNTLQMFIRLDFWLFRVAQFFPKLHYFFKIWP